MDSGKAERHLEWLRREQPLSQASTISVLSWLIAENSRLTRENYDLQDKEAMALGEVTRLTSALFSSRSDAIEEAARVCERRKRLFAENRENFGSMLAKTAADEAGFCAAAVRSLSSTDQGEGERG